MCAAVEATVIEVRGDAAIVEWDGRRRGATTLLVPDVRAGERVLVAFGSILGRVVPDELHRSATPGRTIR